MNNLTNFDSLINLANISFDNYILKQNFKEHLYRTLLYLNDALSLKINYSEDESYKDMKLCCAYILRAKVFFHLKDYLKCINDCNNAEKINNNDYLIYALRGDAKFELNKFQDAIDDYELGILLRPNDFNLFLNKGIAEFELENFKEAINSFDLAKKGISTNSFDYELLKMYTTLAKDYLNYGYQNLLKIIYQNKNIT